MPQAIIYLDERLNKEIEKAASISKDSKHDIILKILNEYFFKNEKRR